MTEPPSHFRRLFLRDGASPADVPYAFANTNGDVHFSAAPSQPCTFTPRRTTSSPCSPTPSMSPAFVATATSRSWRAAAATYMGNGAPRATRRRSNRICATTRAACSRGAPHETSECPADGAGVRRLTHAHGAPSSAAPLRVMPLGRLVTAAPPSTPLSRCPPRRRTLARDLLCPGRTAST